MEQICGGVSLIPEMTSTRGLSVLLFLKPGQGEYIFDNLLDVNEIFIPDSIKYLLPPIPISFSETCLLNSDFRRLGDTDQILNISQMSLQRILYEILMMANPNITFEALIPEFLLF